MAFFCGFVCIRKSEVRYFGKCQFYLKDVKFPASHVMCCFIMDRVMLLLFFFFFFFFQFLLFFVWT